jgi:hypothetical protein
MNKEQQQIIDEVYEKYLTDLKSRKHHEWILSKEEFINKCKTEDALSVKWREEYRDLRYGSKEEIEHLSKHYKTDSEFSETWGVKIKERELSFNERIKHIVNSLKSNAPLLMEEDEKTTQWLNENSIPTKLITLTYNNEKIESYE